jgi:hypothetical protein
VTYEEDKSLVRTGNAPRVMASLPVDWPSAYRAWMATRTSPPRTAITPATRSGPSSYFKLHEHDFAGSLGLRLEAPALTLRLMREADLDTIAELLPEDVEQDPALLATTSAAPCWAAASLLTSPTGPP